MSAQVPAIWTTGGTEGFHTGTWRSAIPVHRDRPSPCHAACPLGGDVATWIRQLAAGDARAAWETLVRRNPFPAIAGRVCHHPCEAACNRRDHDEAVSICALERFAGDRALAEGWPLPEPGPATGRRVAVVGGGPSGLGAAYELRRAGHTVTVFEAAPELGGLLRYGIPPYRLPREVLDGEIARIVALGVEVRTAAPVDGWAGIERLRAGYDAVYLALGATRPKRVAQLDYGKPWILDGAAFLAASNRGDPPPLGARVAVIGGGSAAVDAARSALRQGAQVRIVALESADRMPAQPGEIEEAVEEDIEITAGTMVRRIAESGDGLALSCVEVEFEAGERRGEFTVRERPGTGFEVAADTVIVSIGQDPEIAGSPAGLAFDGALVAVDAASRTSIDGVFAGGDLATLDRFVTEAVGHGRRAAAAIGRYLDAGSAASEAAPEAPIGISEVNTHYHPLAPRHRQSTMPPDERLGGYREVVRALPPSAAVAEAARCFSCGTCIFCDNCFHYCPDMAVRREEGGYSIDTAYCKGCGLCVAECPTGAVAMRSDGR